MAKRKVMEEIDVKLHPSASVPEKGNEFAAGYDVHPIEVKMIAHNGHCVTCTTIEQIKEECKKLRKNDKRSLWKCIKDFICDEQPQKGWKQLWFNSGIMIAPQNVNLYLSAEPCSRTVKTDYVLHNSLGTIDNDYRGYVYLIYHAVCQTYDEDSIVRLFNTCGQLKGKYSTEMQFNVKEELSNTTRGEGGFGSTEKNAK